MAMIPAIPTTEDKDARDRHQLVTLLKTCKCHDNVIEYMLKELGVVTICDFHGLVPEAAFETELVELIIKNVESCQGKHLENSRIRAAWRAARAAVTQTESRKNK